MKDMTQEDKNLLLKDLCARLPYRPIVYVDENLPSLKLGPATRVWEYIAVDKPCKPYFRPKSSMTKEERNEYHSYCDYYYGNYFDTVDSIDWLNKKMFDYRTDEEGKTMIEKGLVLQAPEGMYNIKEK